jgi:hypothetical protein
MEYKKSHIQKEVYSQVAEYLPGMPKALSQNKQTNTNNDKNPP